MPLLVDGEMKEKKWCGQTDTFLTHKEKEAGLQKSESARDEEGKGGWGWWGEVRGREEREEEVPVNVVLKQWWIFTPLHLSPPSCVCVWVEMKGVETDNSGCVNTLNSLSRTHSDTEW